MLKENVLVTTLCPVFTLLYKMNECSHVVWMGPPLEFRFYKKKKKKGTSLQIYQLIQIE